MSKYWAFVGSLSPLISTVQFTTCPPPLSIVSQETSGTKLTRIANSPNIPATIYAADRIATEYINTLALDLTTGGLLANVSTKGGGPTHLGSVNNGAALRAANYDTDSVFIVKLDPTGTDSAQCPRGSGPLPTKSTPALGRNNIQIWVLTQRAF